MKTIVTKISDFSECQFRKMYQGCSKIEQEKIDKLMSKNRKKQSIISHFLLNEEQKTRERITTIKWNQYGKPYYEGINYFNITHQGDYVAIAFSNVPIGIDLETIRLINLTITNQFCTAEEQKWIGTSIKRLFLLYTLKEAYSKLRGESFITGEKINFLIAQNELHFPKTITFSFTITSTYILSICEEKPSSGMLIIPF